jgi:hypothetical protein
MKRLVLSLLFATCAGLASAQTPACKVLDPELAAGRYEGGCEAGLAQGKGQVRGTAAYEGDFVRGQKSGKGVKTYPNGDTYSGDWLADQRSGYGIYRYGAASPWSGDRYQGNWLADKFNGEGSYIWALGDRYDGAWKDGQQAGQPTDVQQQRRRYVTGFMKALAESGNRVCSSGARSASAIFEKGTALGVIDDRILVRSDSSSGDGPPAAARWTMIGHWVPCK